MKPYEKKILEERLKDFMEEVIPVDLFPHLPCLQQTDREEIEARQNFKGPTTANQILVDRLKRRDKAFPQFVRALRNCGNEHTALLLDPFYHYPVNAGDDEVAVTDGSGVGYKKIGTAIDVSFKGNLSFETSADDQQTESGSDLEEYLAEVFMEQSSKESKRMRKDLQKHLPQGAVFVNTAKGSIIATFRLSTVEAAEKLWEMYSEETFQDKLKEVLVEDTLKRLEKLPDKPLELNIRFSEDRFKQIQKKLKEIEEEQERDEQMRSSLCSKQEGSAAENDGSLFEMEDEIVIPPVFLGSNANSFNSELELREYQKELAAPALKGKNTIICAPTNSGKTFVALEIAKKHLESFSLDTEAADCSNRKQPKVVFIVSTVNLVSQQKERFEAFLGYKYPVVDISGAKATEVPLKYLLQSHSIFVMTAQILVNALNSKNKEEQVNLEDISLLLFDECHHAQKGHPYSRIMERYLAFKKQPRDQGPLPQVVGFTASLGTGKAKSVEKAEEHILLVSANLDAEVISTVQENQSELEKYANVPTRKVFPVPTTGKDPFEKIVSQIMTKIEAKVKGIKGKLLKSVPPDEKGSQQYRQWVEGFYKDSVTDADRILITLAEHLREYHIALTINKSTTMKNARKCLKKYFDSLDREKFLPVDEKLTNLYQTAMNMLDEDVKEHGEPTNPLLMKLKDLLLQHFKDVRPQKMEKDKTGANGLDNGIENECSDEGSVAERSEVEDDDDVSEKIRRTSSSSEKDDETGDGSKKENRNEGTSPDEVAQNGEESGGNSFEDSRDHGNIGATDDEEGEKESESVKAEENNHEKPSQEANKSEENFQDEKSSNKIDGEQREWKGPKGIVFTRTRESTAALDDWIKEDEELKAFLRPKALVGSGDGNIGMTQNEQERVISRFHKGETNLLLATSVAEEGLDIMDCNFVIRYDMMGNEISTVQSRGRVRAEVGIYSVLVSGDSGALKREFTNQFREVLMIEALSKVQKMDPINFQRKVKVIQDKNFQDHKLKMRVMALQNSEPVPDDVTFHCRKCNKEVCQAHNIRRVKGTYHVIISSDGWDSKVVMEEHHNPKTNDGVERNKKIFCKRCGEDWGVTVLINGMEWICIKISGFVLQFPEPKARRLTVKKWKLLPFRIEEATFEELMQQAQQPELKDDLDDDLSLTFD